MAQFCFKVSVAATRNRRPVQLLYQSKVNLTEFVMNIFGQNLQWTLETDLVAASVWYFLCKKDFQMILLFQASINLHFHRNFCSALRIKPWVAPCIITFYGILKYCHNNCISCRNFIQCYGGPSKETENITRFTPPNVKIIAYIRGQYFGSEQAQNKQLLEIRSWYLTNESIRHILRNASHLMTLE